MKVSKLAKQNWKPDRKHRLGEIVSGRIVVASPGLVFVRLAKRRFAAELILNQNGYLTPFSPRVGEEWRCKVIQTGPGLARLSPLGPRR